MSAKVNGSALPVASVNTVEFQIASAEFKVIKVRPAQTAAQVPIATIIVANPTAPQTVLYADMFMNGLTNPVAQNTLGNVYKGDLDVSAAVPVMDRNDPTKQAVTTKGELLTSRLARLTSLPVLTQAAPKFTSGLAVA